jgi:hypothetical protein
MGCAIALALVADRTGTSGITPGISAVSATGYKVVNRKIPFRQRPAALFIAGPDSTVDTSIAISS